MITGLLSRLNKHDINQIGSHVQVELAVVAALNDRLGDMVLELTEGRLAIAKVENAALKITSQSTAQLVQPIMHLH